MAEPGCRAGVRGDAGAEGSPGAPGDCCRPAAPAAGAGEAEGRRRTLRAGIVLVVLTLLWNVAETGIALVAGWQAGSIALVGFGLDSVLEVTAGLVVLWRLLEEKDGVEPGELEEFALRVVGLTFFVLAGYVTWQAGWTLWKQVRPEESLLGILLSVASLVAMPALAWAKRRAGRRLGSRALAAEATGTFACAWLSFSLLLGLGLNAWAGWWWADPVAAIVMCPFLVREGIEAFRGDPCC